MANFSDPEAEEIQDEVGYGRTPAKRVKMMDSEEEVGYVRTPAKRMKMITRMDVKHKKTLARMEAEDKAWREVIRAETEAIRARTNAMREERMKANMDACMEDIKNDRKETTACQDAMEANLETMEPNPGGNEVVVERRETLNEEGTVCTLRACRNETMANQETMEARLKKDKPTSMELKPEVADEEVTLENAVLVPVGEPRKMRWDRHVAAQRRQEVQKRTQRKDGCRKNLAAARHAAVLLKG
jgi:hypothetical protein